MVGYLFSFLGGQKGQNALKFKTATNLIFCSTTSLIQQLDRYIAQWHCSAPACLSFSHPYACFLFRMPGVLSSDLDQAIQNVVGRLHGIDKLYPTQVQLLDNLVNKDNVFFTSATNSGKGNYL